MFSWSKDVPKLAIDNGIESSEFYGNKILSMKQPDHTAWLNSFRAALKSLIRKTIEYGHFFMHFLILSFLKIAYVQANFSTGLIWKFKGSDDFKQLYAVLLEEKPVAVVAPVLTVISGPTGVPPPPPPPMLNLKPISLDDVAPKTDSGNSNNALLSALNVGEDAIKARINIIPLMKVIFII